MPQVPYLPLKTKLSSTCLPVAAATQDIVKILSGGDRLLDFTSAGRVRGVIYFGQSNLQLQ